MSYAREHKITKFVFLGTKTKVVPFCEKKVFLVELLCKVALPVAYVSCDLCSYLYGCMIEAWTDKVTTQSYFDNESKVDTQNLTI